MMFATRMNMKSMEHQGEELHPLLAGGALYGVGDKLVGRLHDRLHPPGTIARGELRPSAAPRCRPL